jgi:hypothetical protein
VKSSCIHNLAVLTIVYEYSKIALLSMVITFVQKKRDKMEALERFYNDYLMDCFKNSNYVDIDIDM